MGCTSRHKLLLIASILVIPAAPMPAEPLHEKHLKGIPIKGYNFPIGPGTDQGLYNELFEGDILYDPSPVVIRFSRTLNCWQPMSDENTCFYSKEWLKREEVIFYENGNIYLEQVLKNDSSAKDIYENIWMDGKNAVSSPALLWPRGAVVYKVDDDVGCPDSPQCDILMRAMDHYHSKSCIRFKEWSGEKNFIRIFFNVKETGACWSPVGRVGKGEQKLSLGQRCWYLGIVVHELGHAIGFWHEMNRPDRDNWIYIFWSNILPSYTSAFNKQDSSTVNTLGEAFDYKSVMMYDEYAFSKDGKSPTLQSKKGNEIGPIWKKAGLSDSDLRRLKMLYRCEGNKPKKGFPYDTVCDFNLHTCGFKNGGSAVWNWRTVNDTDGYVYSSFENSGTTPGFLMSINFHKADLQSKESTLGCVRFWYLIQDDTIAYLKLSQSYLDKVTQLDNDPETTFELWYNDTSEGQWLHVAVPLYVTRPFRLIFESEFSEDNTYGTIALDDIELLYRECSSEGISDTAEAETTDSSETSERPLVTTPSTSALLRYGQGGSDYDHNSGSILNNYYRK